MPRAVTMCTSCGTFSVSLRVTLIPAPHTGTVLLMAGGAPVAVYPVVRAMVTYLFINLHIHYNYG